MKKIYLYITGMMLAVSGISAEAQQSLNVTEGNVTYSFPATSEVMPFTNGTGVTIQGRQFDLANISKMQVVNSEQDPATVLVEYSGDEAFVTIAGDIANYVSAEVNGAHVTLNQSDEVGADTTGEITYVLKGESSDGSLLFNGSYKSTIELQGLTLINPSGAAIDIENGKRIDFSSKNNTVNTLADGEGGNWKAALYCKGHLEFKGKGTLNVTGNTSHAISAKEYVEMKNCTINILGSVKDGINCNQYFLIESGELNILNPGDDGVQVSYKDSSDREDEDTGNITIAGGTVTINEITATAAKGFKAENSFIMTDGEVTVLTSAPGEWDADKLKTKASACIGADGDVEISGGSLNLTATGGGGKGISCDGEFIFNEGDLEIVTTGGMLAYVNGTLNQNYTGNADRINSDYKSSPKGVKADGNVEINGGTIFVSTTGNGAEGIESKGELTVTGGNVKVRAKDDAINSANTMYIKGGVVDVISTNNDGLDSNGDLYIEGGLVMAFGGGAPECGLDANDEQGYTVYFTGGYVLGAGGGRSSLPKNSNSTQPYVNVTLPIKGGNDVTIGTGTENIYTFTAPEDLAEVSSGGWGGGSGNGLNVVVSVPGLVVGDTYTLSSGNQSVTGEAVQYSSGGGWGGGGGWPW